MQKFPIIAMESQGMPCHCQTRISNVRRSAGKLEGGDSDKTVPIANLYKKLEPVLQSLDQIQEPKRYSWDVKPLAPCMAIYSSNLRERLFYNELHI